MLSELYAAADPGKAVHPQFFAPVTDRAAWQALPAAKRWIAVGDELLRTARDPEPLPLNLWLDYSRTGNRNRFELMYFRRRRYLSAFTMAECMRGDGTYLPAVADYLWAICSEPGWQLPAHTSDRNSGYGPVRFGPLSDPERPIIDLFAAETGATVATVYGMLGEQLDAWAPGLRDFVGAELERRILRPYREHHFWWMGDGETAMCNWTTWCTQNVMIAAAMVEPAERLAGYVKQAAYSLDCFLKDYGEDGCCDEGAQYYRRAALTFFNGVDVMDHILPGAFSPLWKEDKIRNMAEYIVNVHIAGPSYLNFSDCSPAAGRRDVQDYLLAQKVGSMPLLALAAQDVKAALDHGDPDRMHDLDVCEGTNLYQHMQFAFTEPEIRAWQGPTPEEVPPRNIWYESVGLMVSRCGPYVLGTKAGCNDDSHNHNDTGSVTLYKNGQPLLIDVGVETYTKKTFSPQRYEIWTMQSSWHNLPEFDPDGAAYKQLPGADCRATQVTMNEARTALSMELARAYGPDGTVPGLHSYRRAVELTADGLTLTDTTDYPGTVALTLMSVEKPAAEGNTVTFGTLAALTAQGACKITVEPVPVQDERLRWSWPDMIYRTRLYFTGTLQLQLR